MHQFLPTTMAAFVSVVLSSLAGAAAQDVVADTRFNRERGFYDSGFAVVIPGTFWDDFAGGAHSWLKWGVGHATRAGSRMSILTSRGTCFDIRSRLRWSSAW